MSISHKVNGTWQKTAGLPPVDSVLSSTSQNPLENRQIYAALADKITASVSNLVNYYKKSETYTQAEVRQLIGAISTLSIKVVAALPTTDISATTIYWVGPDATTGKYDQYIYSNNTWVKTGDTSVNLGDYVTTEALELAIADFLTETDVSTILASYYTKTEIDTLLNGKQNSLTFDDAPTENSANVVKSGGVYSAVDDVYKVMGENGAKNLLPNNTTSKTINGITYTVNDDGSVTANGTATANAEFIFIKDTDDVTWFKNLIRDKTVTLSGCPSGGSGTTYTLRKWGQSTSGTYYDNGNGVTFTADAESLDNNSWNFQIRVYNGVTVSNLTFYPMLRLASDTDSTYQPYAKTNQQLTEEDQTLANRVEGNWSGDGKNLLPIKYSKITSYGLTWEKSNDGYIILNGTSTASPAQQSLFDATPVVVTLSKGTIISLKELGIDNTKKYIFSRDTKIANVRPRIDLWSDSEKLLEVELSNNDGLYKEIDFSQYPTCTGIKATIQVTLNTTLTNAIQKIMLCLKSVYELDSTFAPYAKTNQQLTEDTTALLDNLEVNGAVNMLPNNATTQTINGITFTVNDDGTVKVNGTATERAELKIYTNTDGSPHLVGKTVKLSGCSSDGGGESTYRLQAYRVGAVDGSTGTFVDNGDGIEFTWLNNGSGTKAIVSIIVFSGVTVSNLTFKPMITVPSYNGDYVPYAKSNRELTENVADIVTGGAYVHKLPSYFYHIAITASTGSGQLIKLVTVHGEINLATSSHSMRIPQGQKVLLNQSNDTSEWTYSLDGLTANLNCTGHLVGYIISNYPLTFTVVDTSTPEANTLETLNLALLSNS